MAVEVQIVTGQGVTLTVNLAGLLRCSKAATVNEVLSLHCLALKVKEESDALLNPASEEKGEKESDKGKRRD